MSAPRHSRSVRWLLLTAAAPASLALALAAGPAHAANNTPVPSAPPPSSGSNWANVFIDPSYDPTSTSNSIEALAPRAYAEWTYFNVTTGSQFSVEGMNQDWIIVNRVVGVGPTYASDISGHINAPGQFWLINPNGIVVSQTGSFDVGGLVLSTATGFDTNSFLAGSSLNWTFTGATQPIVVNGTVIAEHGVVALLAPQITIGDASPSSGAGAIIEGSAGQAQVVAIAAQDVSLTFAEDGNQLYQLDGAVIQRGVAGNGPGTVGGVSVNESAVIRAGRVFIAAGGETAPVDVLITGSLTATQARQDGQDIVLMTTDLAPVGAPQTVADGHASGGPNGPVHDGAVTSAGGYVLLDPYNLNTIYDPTQITDPNAATGAGVTVRAAGTALLGDAANPVGDLDIKANGLITSQLGKGALSAVDIALQSPGEIQTGDLNARDDIVVRAGGVFSAGAVNAGTTVLDQGPTDPSISDPTEAGERLVARAGALSFAGHDFDLVGHDVDVIASSIDTGAVTASDAGGSSLGQPLSDVRLQAFGPSLGTISVGDVTAPRDILIDAYGAASAGALVAGRDIAANSFAGNLVFTSADAQDDIVLGAAGQLVVSGDLTTHGQDSSAANQVGDLFVQVAPLYAYSPTGPGGAGGVAFDVTGSDIDVVAGSIRVGGTSTAVGAGSDVRFQAGGSIALHDVVADQDILIDAGTSAVTGALTAGRDVAARAYSGALVTGAIDAQDDVVLRSGGDMTVGGAITVHGQDSAAADQSGDLLAQAAPLNAFSPSGPGGSGGTSFTVAGSTVDAKAGGQIAVSGLVDAQGVEPSLNAPNSSDARFQATGAVTLTGGVTAGRDVLIDAGQGVTVGQTLLAGRDIGIRSMNGSIDITGSSADAAARAGDDIVLRAGGDIAVTGRLATYGGSVGVGASSPNQAGDLLVAVDPMTLHGFSFDVSNGADIDVLAQGAISISPNGSGLTGYGSAYGGPISDVRLQAGGAITLNDAVASRDVLIDGGLAVSVNDALEAGRDVAVRSRASSVSIGVIVAGDDAVIRAAGAVVIAGQTTAEGFDSNAAGQVGDLLAADDPLNAYSAAGPGQPGGVSFGEGGSNIDIKGGSIFAGDVQTAATDARFQAPGQISLAAVSAGRDVLIDAGQMVSVGGLTAGRDVAARSYLAGISTGDLDAGDDVVLRSGHTASSGGGITTQSIVTHGANDASAPDQSGDLLFAADPMTLSTPFSVGNGSDVDVLSHNGDITVQSFIDAAGDARLQTDRNAGGGDVLTASVTSETGDILLDGANVGASLDSPVTLVANGDAAVRARNGTVAVESITAGDDIVVRAAGDVTVTNGLTSGGGADTVGAADRIIASGESQAMSVGTVTFGLAGADIDVIAGVALSGATTPTAAIAIQGPVNAAGAGSDARFQAQGAILFGLIGEPADVVAGQDILSDGALGSVATVQVTGALTAGRDIALSARLGSVALTTADAQDDIVIRAGQQVTATGDLTNHGADSSAAGQAGDALAARDPINAFSVFGPGHPGGTTFTTTGADIDIKAGAIALQGLTASGTGADARLQATGAISLGGAQASQDLLIDAGQGVSAAAMTAGRDIGVRAYAGGVSTGPLDAGDDVVLRSGGASGIAVGGTVTTHAGGNDPSSSGQVGDLLATADPVSLGAAPFQVSGAADVDMLAHGGPIAVTGAIVSAGYVVLQTTGGGGVSTGDVTAASGDLLLDGASVQRNGSASTNTLLAPTGDVAVRARSGALQITAASAGDDIVLRGQTGVTVAGALSSGGGGDSAGAGDQLAAADPIISYWAASPSAIGLGGGGNVDVRSAGPVALAGAVTANGTGANVRIDSGGAVSLTNVQMTGAAGGQVMLVATSLALAGQINAPGADLLLFARATALSGGGTAPAVLGGPANTSDPGFVFNSVEIAHTTVRSLTLFSGTDASASSNVVVRDLQYSATLRTVRVFSGPGSRIDVTGQVTDPAGTDAVFLAGAAPGDTALPTLGQGAAAAPVAGVWTPDVVRVSGGLGVTGAPLADIRFDARSIYIAPSSDTALGGDFETAVQSQAPEALAPYAGSVTLQIRAGRLDLRAADAVLERNLQPSGAATDGMGLQLGGLTLNTLGTGSTPARVSLFGALDSSLAGVLPPPAGDKLIDGIAAAYLLRFTPASGAAVGYPAPVTAADYRFNGCAFGGFGCVQALGPGATGAVGGQAGATGGATTAADGAAASVAAQSEADSASSEGATPGLANPSVVTQAVDPFAPVEEEPVTNTGGEITWPAPSNTPERKR